MPKAAFSLIELIIVIAIISILLTTAFVMLNPKIQLNKANDTKRINDITHLSKAIVLYQIEAQTLPGTENTLRQSNVNVLNNRLSNATFGWIGANLSTFIRSMPVDPINNNTYNYRYINVNGEYEIDALLENPNQASQQDGGNNPNRVELGTNLQLLD